MLPSENPKFPTDPLVRGFPGIWKLLLFHVPPWDGSPSLTCLSLFLSFIFCPTYFWRQWTAFLGTWCPLPAFRSCFVVFAQYSDDLSVNLWGREWSLHPIPPPSLTFCMSLLFNMLSRLVIPFLARSKRLLISWLQSPSAVILEPKKRKSDTVSTVSPSICHEVMGLDDMIFVFWIVSFKPTFSLSSRGFLVLLHFLPYGWCHLHIWGYWYFSRQSWFQLVLHPVWHFSWYTLYTS